MSSFKRIVALLARLVVGGVLLKAGYAKLGDPAGLAEAIAGFGLVPRDLITLLAVALPWLECLVGGCLIAGLLTASASVVAGGLTLTFAWALSSALSRGLDIRCGCFGHDDSARVSQEHLGLDLALLLLSLLVLLWGPGLAALDRHTHHAPDDEPT